MNLDHAARKLLHEAADQLAECRRLYPEADYAARLYVCRSCPSVGATVAPADELPDGYPCPECGKARVPLTGIRYPSTGRRPYTPRPGRRRGRGHG